jgi:hypothetical protein
MPDWVTVTVKNEGSYVLSYTLQATADGQPLEYNPGDFPQGSTKTTQLPAASTDISLVIKDARAVKDWHTMHEQTWTDASGWTDGAVVFEATGSTFHEHCHQVQ